MRTNKTLGKMIFDLRDEFSIQKSLETEIDLKRFEIQRTHNAVIGKRLKVQQLTMEISLHIMKLNQANNRNQNGQAQDFIDRIFLEEDDDHPGRNQETRRTVHELHNILSFVYCTDNVQPMTDEELRGIENYIRDN